MEHTLSLIGIFLALLSIAISIFGNRGMFDKTEDRSWSYKPETQENRFILKFDLSNLSKQGTLECEINKRIGHLKFYRSFFRKSEELVDLREVAFDPIGYEVQQTSKLMLYWASTFIVLFLLAYTLSFAYSSRSLLSIIASVLLTIGAVISFIMICKVHSIRKTLRDYISFLKKEEVGLTWELTQSKSKYEQRMNDNSSEP